MTARISIGGFSVDPPLHWRLLSDRLRDDDEPYTIADPEYGVGALQFSPALYREGPVPTPSTDELLSMVLEFAESRALGSPLSTSHFHKGVLAAGAEFQDNDDFVVVWYVSDGKNFMLVTYVCDWESRDIEAEERDGIVRSIRF